MERTYEEAVKDIKAAIFDIVDSEKKTTLSLKKQIEEETDEDKKNELEELHKEKTAKIDAILENADIIINDVEILEKINFDNNLKADDLIKKIEEAKSVENEQEDTIDTDEDEDEDEYEDEKEDTTEGKLIEDDDEEDEDEEENVEEESESEEETDEIEEDEEEKDEIEEETDEIEEDEEEKDEIEENETEEETKDIEEAEEENTEEETDEIEENETEEENNEVEEVQEETKSSEEPVLVVPIIAEAQEKPVEEKKEEVTEENTEEPVEDVKEVEETPVENTNDKWAFNKEDKNAPRAIMVIKTQEEKLTKSRDAQTLKVKAAGLFNDYDYNKSTANTIKGDVITKSIEEELNFAALENLPLERQIEDLTVKLNIYNDEGEVEIANAISNKIKELKEKLNLSASETEEATTKVKAA